jgi:hypothetical protein
MTECIIEPKRASWVEIGWDLVSVFFLMLATIGFVYGWSYRGLGVEILVPSFMALILACYAKLCCIEGKIHD